MAIRRVLADAQGTWEQLDAEREAADGRLAPRSVQPKRKVAKASGHWSDKPQRDADSRWYRVDLRRNVSIPLTGPDDPRRLSDEERILALERKVAHLEQQVRAHR